MKKVLFLLIGLMMVACEDNRITIYEALEPPKNPVQSFTPPDEMKVTPMKWYQGKKGVVSITYDGSWGFVQRINWAVNAVVERGLRMDFEMVTVKYDNPENQVFIDSLLYYLKPMGIGFFGHGHEHINHDSLGYSESYESFKLCFDLMDYWGLNPISYAYPGGRGYYSHTQLACKDAGFVAARGYTINEDEFYMCAGDKKEPENWFYMPSVPLADDAPSWIENHEELAPVLQKTKDLDAWVILMYHAVGIPESFGYYSLDEFKKDLDQMVELDLWCANTDQVVQYIKEKNNFKYSLDTEKISEDTTIYRVTFSDNLDNSRFNFPLSVEISLTDGNTYSEMEIEPAILSGNRFGLIDNKTRVELLPDEKVYTITVFTSADK